MKNIFNLFTFLILSLPNIAQTGSYYGNLSDAADFCAIQLETTNSFSTNNEAQIALNKVIKVLGISQRFAMYQCNGIDNCAAVTIRGIRYIYYDTYFMKEISNNANSYWTNLSILAHEIGHHINGHTVDLIAYLTGEIKPLSLAEKRQQEIEADEISGYVMFKLGATLYQAQQAINLISLDGDDTYSTHPNKTKRLNAIKIGYDKAKSQSTYIFDNASTNNSNLTAEDYFYLAYNNELDYQYKLENYTKFLKMQPNNAVGHYNRGLVYYELKNYNAAISDYSSAIKINPNYSNAYFNRGLAYDWSENYKAAIADYSSVIKLKPNNDDAYYNRAFAYEMSENNKAAIADYSSAIKINPNNDDAYVNRGILYHESGNDKSAIADYSSAIKINPDDADAYYNRGNVYSGSGNYKYAIADFSSAIKVNPNYAKAYFNRGLAYGKSENYNAAIADFSNAIKINPNYAKAYHMRGFAKIKAGQSYYSDYKKACDLGIKECCD